MIHSEGRIVFLFISVQYKLVPFDMGEEDSPTTIPRDTELSEDFCCVDVQTLLCLILTEESANDLAARITADGEIH